MADMTQATIPEEYMDLWPEYQGCFRLVSGMLMLDTARHEALSRFLSSNTLVVEMVE